MVSCCVYVEAQPFAIDPTQCRAGVVTGILDRVIHVMLRLASTYCTG